jgi:23S rRNA (cytosine1962-C5)-methyltransferase
MSKLPRVILKPGREKAILHGHPWIFSGAVSNVEGEATPGNLAEIRSAEGLFLGLGHLNPRSQIFVRLLSAEKEDVDRDFFLRRISKAAVLREAWLARKTNAYRIVNGEGDFLPGLIVDRYGQVLVLQCLTAGMERVKGLLVDVLVDRIQPESIYERSDVTVRKEEGLQESSGLLYGREVPERIEIEEGDCRFWVYIRKGQKTGFYLDQRENRLSLDGFVEEKKVLDCCSYTGAFSIHAARKGAREVTLMDTSREALEIAEEHFRLNGLIDVSRQFIRRDAFEALRGLSPDFDVIFLDPAPFAKKKGHLPAAARGYKDLNLQAFRVLKEGGFLFTFSCSHHMNWDLFTKVVFSAAADAGRKVQLLGRRGHPIDHPVNLCHPEGEYLKGLVCRVG